jgi:hypothetical protein
MEPMPPEITGEEISMDQGLAKSAEPWPSGVAEQGAYFRIELVRRSQSQ